MPQEVFSRAILSMWRRPVSSPPTSAAASILSLRRATPRTMLAFVATTYFGLTRL